jgi:hypothetical protein
MTNSVIINPLNSVALRYNYATGNANGVEEIRHLYTLLSKAGFGTVDHLKSEKMDYSDIKDFRYWKDLYRQIINHDLEYI